MNGLRWYGCSAHLLIAHLTKRAAPLINLLSAQHLMNCAIFGQSRIALAMRFWVKVRTTARIRVCFRVRVRLWLGLRNWPNAQRVWSNAQIGQMHLTWLGFCFQIPRNIYNLKRKRSMLKF